MVSALLDRARLDYNKRLTAFLYAYTHVLPSGQFDLIRVLWHTCWRSTDLVSDRFLFKAFYSFAVDRDQKFICS
jgi:hypothetical protein